MIADELECLGVKYLPEFTDFLSPLQIPSPVAESIAEQLAATSLFLTVEHQRHRLVLDGGDAHSVLILDRSIDTLAAHVAGIAAYLGKPWGYDDAVGLIGQAPRTLRPDVTFLLQVPISILSARATYRPRLPDVYLDARFHSGFESHFYSTNIFSADLRPIDGTAEPEDVCTFISDQLRTLLSQDHDP